MALTISPTHFHFCSWGNKRVCFATITGDLAGTATLAFPLGKIEAAWAGNQTENAGWNAQLSWSGNTLTYAVAPASTKKHTIFAVGSD
jgi:hypothetical protein